MDLAENEFRHDRLRRPVFGASDMAIGIETVQVCAVGQGYRVFMEFRGICLTPPVFTRSG
ncbi:MAG: hypothetical protein JOZ00_14040 [Mycobacterium sp.]|uniref:hypothetical protein n=1 Tax=Mycobacterium sp. TaxID=1785 RepID=UPI001ECE9DF0|nr:hypothetical protein [Mycobacterium sp.]MBV8787793.1 hypothetical protein [Mycobacterium sp.]